jgi:hypothetical protein
MRYMRVVGPGIGKYADLPVLAGAGPEVAGEAAHHHHVETVEHGVAVAASVDVIGEHAFTVIVSGRLREFAGAGNIAGTYPEFCGRGIS